MLHLKTRPIWLTHLAFSPDGQALAVSGYHGVVQVWDLATQQTSHTLKTGHWNNSFIAFMGTDSLLVLYERELLVYELATGKQTGRIPSRGYATSQIAALSSDGKRLGLARTYGGTFEQFDLPEGKRAWRISPNRIQHFVRSLTYSLDGQSVAIGTNEGLTYIHETATGKRVQTLKSESKGEVRAAALSPNGERLATCTGTRLRLWRVETGEEISQHSLGTTHFLSVACHPSGAFFATANGDGKVDYWDATTGARRESFDWKVGKVQFITFDATGDRAACCSTKGDIVIWDVDR